MRAEDFDLAIHRYFEGTLAPEDEAAFWQRVRTDPAAADRFVELAELESGLVESQKADLDMPSGVYAAIHGTRRRPRPFPQPQGRAAWPYWAAAGLFIAALSLVLRPGVGPDHSRDLTGPAPATRDRGADPVADPVPPSVASPVPAPGLPTRTDLEARRSRQQQVLRDLEQKQEELAAARSKAEADQKVQAQQDLERRLVELDTRRRTETAKLVRVEEDLAKPEDTRVQAPDPAPGLVLEVVEGEASWAGEPARPVKPGQPVPPGAGLLTHGARSRLVLKLPDDTRLELRGDSRMEEIQGQGTEKRFTIAQGTLWASIAKQGVGQSFVFLTPQAELTVLGTRFLLQVGAEETRLDVEEGRIRNRRVSDKKVVEVPAGHTLLTTRGGTLVARPLPIVRSFQDGVLPSPDYAGTKDTSIGSNSPTTAAGTQDLLRLYKNQDGGQNSVLIRWDVSSIPVRSRVVSAELTFWVTGGTGGSGRAFELRRPWEELDATWKIARSGVPWQLAGARGEADASSKSLGAIAPSGTGWSTFPLNTDGIAVVQQWVSVPPSNHGLGISKDPPNAWDLASREWATPEHRPKLTVSYLPPAK